MGGRPLDQALEACDRGLAEADPRTAEDQIMALEGDLREYFHSWYTEEETDALLRDWRRTHGIGQTALEGLS